MPLAEHRQQLDRAMGQLIEGKSGYDVTFGIRRPNDGARRIVRSMAVYDASRRTISGALQDITELHRLNAELREKQAALAHREERFRLLAENTRDVIWRMGLDLRFEYINPAVDGLLGKGPGEVVGTHLARYVRPGKDLELRGRRIGRRAGARPERDSRRDRNRAAARTTISARHAEDARIGDAACRHHRACVGFGTGRRPDEDGGARGSRR